MPPTIEQLQEEVKSLKAALAEADKAKKALEAQLAEAQAENEKLLGHIEGLQKELEESENAARTAPAKFPSRKVGSQVFEVIYPRIEVDGRQMTAEEVAGNAEVMKKLVKAGSGAVRPKN